MSYEGYVQYWCNAGHYWVRDAYESSEDKCPVCSQPVAVENSVDETNCDQYGLIVPVIDKSGPKCPTCGHVEHEADTYKIPDLAKDRYIPPGYVEPTEFHE